MVHVLGLVLAALVAQAAPTASPSLPPSNDLLFRALDRLRSYGTPSFVVYLAEENGQTRRIAFRGADEMMNDSAFSAGVSALPPARVYRAFVGPLAYSLHEAIATPPPSTGASPMDIGSQLKTIVVVSSHGRLYDVHIGGIQTINDHSTYHVTLRPLRDAERNALRDMWIDTTTYDVVRADYVYPNPPDVGVPGSEADITVNFETVGQYRIAARWIAIYHFLGPSQAVYRELRVTKMVFPTDIPVWFFDAGLYAAHRREGDADPLAGIF